MLLVYELGLFGISANDLFVELEFYCQFLSCVDAQIPVPVVLLRYFCIFFV